MTFKVIVIEDSAFMRKSFQRSFKDIQQIEIIEIVRSMEDATDSIKRIRPDFIFISKQENAYKKNLDIDSIMMSFKIPVVMFGFSGDAIRNGLIGICDNVSGGHRLIEIDGDLTKLLKELKKCSKSHRDTSPSRADFNVDLDSRVFNAVVIGSSTGGPRALSHIIKKLPESIRVPIFIVQHLPKKFTTSLAERLNNESKVLVVEAKDEMSIKRGVVYLAPGDYHMTVDKGVIRLARGEKIHGVRPAVDPLFETASIYYGDGLFGAVLTGMGKDGTNGMKAIKEMGGYGVAQDEETSVVYGMPGNAVAKGVIDDVLSIDEISSLINRIVR